MHGVSAIISLILILMIVVALSALAYTWFSGIFTSTKTATEKSITRTTTGLLTQMKIETISLNNVYIRNIGQTDLGNLSVYIDDVPADFNITPNTIKPGEVGIIKIYDFTKENDNIKITSSQGTVTTKTSPNPCTQAFLCLKLDEGSGNTAFDSSPSGNVGTLVGPSWVDGKFGKALNFDGLNDYLNTTINGITTYSTKTIIFWYKIPNGNNPDNYEIMEWSGIFSLFKQGVNDWQLYAFNSTHGIRFRYFDFVSTGDNIWHFKIIVIGYDSSGQPRYVEDYTDGILKENKTTPDYASSGQSFGNFYLANAIYPGGISFNGTIDEVRIFNKAIY